jgi:hypothetical protein
MEEKDIIKFDDYCKILYHFEGKNQFYKQQFFIVDGDVSAFDTISELDDEMIEQRIKYWNDEMTIEPKYHDNILGKDVPKIESLSTSQWVKIVDYIDSEEHAVLTFPIILHYLTGADVDEIKNMPHRVPAELVTFFLSTLKNFMEDSQNCSKVPPVVQKNVKYHLALRQLSTWYTQLQKEVRENLTLSSNGQSENVSALQKLKSKLPKKLRKQLKKRIENEVN